MTPPSDNLARKRTPSDFVFGKVIGEGSFSTVYLAKEVQTSREFAIKVLDKRHIIKEKKVAYVASEKRILQLIDSSCKCFVHLYYTFQDTDRLYFVLTLARNGELLQQIIKHKKFSLDTTRYCTCELVLALEYLKRKGIVHRDLKPENILFDINWHIIITDFGSAKMEDEVKPAPVPKIDDKNKERKNSFVGTAQYVSPEVLEDLDATCAADLWALGCIIYQMISGQLLFKGDSEFLIFRKVTSLRYNFPDSFDETAKDLIVKFLVIEPDERLGATDPIPYQSIRQHEFFENVIWDNLGPPPKLFQDNNCDNESVSIPEHLEPGLDLIQETRLHFEQLQMPSATTPRKVNSKTPSLRKKSETILKVSDLTNSEIDERLEMQKTNIYNDLVKRNLIIKQGLIEKRKGLFPRRRMLLLTLGPHLYYVDPTTMILKGEIPWSEHLRTEAKNFKKFLIHTPNRIYHLEDPDGYALEWCRAIEEVKSHYYPNNRS